MKDFKKDFKEWYNTQIIDNKRYLQHYHLFNNQDQSMQWGLYVDFFNEKGYYIDVWYEKTRKPKLVYTYEIADKENDCFFRHEKDFKTLLGARKRAFKHAKEVYEKE